MQTKHMRLTSALSKLLVFFFFFISIFPSFRLLTVGSQKMRSPFEIAITILPEIVLAAILIISAVIARKEGLLQKKSLGTFDKVLIGFIASNVILGACLSQDLLISAYGFRITYLPIFFYFVARVYVVYDTRILNGVLRNIFLWFVYFAIIGLVMYFLFHNFFSYLVSMTGYQEGEYFIKRMGSLVLTPVLFGTIMSFSLIYFYYSALSKPSRLNYTCIGILWLCLIMSVSRGAIISALISLVILTLLFKNWRSTIIAGSVMAVITGLFMLTLTFSSLPVQGNVFSRSQYTSDTTSAGNNKNSTGKYSSGLLSTWIVQSSIETVSMKYGVSRVELWKLSFESFKARPWGYGLGKAGASAVRFMKSSNAEVAVATSDGWYLKIANETGIWGIVSFGALVCFYCMRTIGFIRNHKGTFVSFVFAIFIMVLIQNIVSNVLDFYPFICLFWLLIGISENYMNKATPEHG